jgi:hypothetical protein
MWKRFATAIEVSRFAIDERDVGESAVRTETDIDNAGKDAGNGECPGDPRDASVYQARAYGRVRDHSARDECDDPAKMPSTSCRDDVGTRWALVAKLPRPVGAKVRVIRIERWMVHR